MRHGPPRPDRRIRTMRWGKRLGRAEQTLGADAVEPRLRGLAALLLRCAEREPGATAALRHWDGGRLQQMLARMLDDPERVRVALDRLLADLSGGQGAFRGNGEAAAQDWLFARMRLAVRQSGGLPPLRTVPWERAPEPPPHPAAPGPSPGQRPRRVSLRLASPIRACARPGAGPIAARRSRRAAVPAGATRRILAGHRSAAAGGNRRRAGRLRGGVARVHARLADPAGTGTGSGARGGTGRAGRSTTGAARADAGTSVEVLIGPPLAARDLPVVSDPIVRAPPADPPPEPPAPVTAPGPAVPRVVIHHGAGRTVSRSRSSWRHSWARPAMARSRSGRSRSTWRPPACATSTVTIVRARNAWCAPSGRS